MTKEIRKRTRVVKTLKKSPFELPNPKNLGKIQKRPKQLPQLLLQKKKRMMMKMKLTRQRKRMMAKKRNRQLPIIMTMLLDLLSIDALDKEIRFG
jgi:hypothetical protein